MYVFELVAGTWIERQRLLAPDGSAYDKFGNTVAVGGDLIVVGAAADDPFGSFSGSAYVFRRSGSTWSLEQKLVSSTIDNGDEFGWNVVTDGTTILASAVSDEQGAAATGAVFVFEEQGGLWQQTQRLVPSDAGDGDRFGWDLELDGDRLAVGATNHDAAGTNSGTVYMFERSGGSFAQTAKLLPSKLQAGDSFGWSLALDGPYLAAGAPNADGYTGALFQFHYDGSAWVEAHKWVSDEVGPLTFPPPALGMSCAMDGTTVLGGDPWGNGPTTAKTGIAYRFESTPLGLDATPDFVEPGMPILFETFGGLADGPSFLFLTAVGGAPVAPLLLDSGAFDAAGKDTWSVGGFTGFSGLSFGVTAAGLWTPTALGISQPVTVLFL